MAKCGMNWLRMGRNRIFCDEIAGFWKELASTWELG